MSKVDDDLKVTPFLHLGDRPKNTRESYKNAVILQVQKSPQVYWKNIARKRMKYLTDISCWKIEQIRSLLQESSQDLASFV